MAFEKEWRGFKGTHWTDDVNVRDFIQDNYTPYDGDESFLAGPTDATNKLWGRLQEIQKAEIDKGYEPDGQGLPVEAPMSGQIDGQQRPQGNETQKADAAADEGQGN